MRIVLFSLLLLGGCSAIPSFYDDNESMLAVNVRYAAFQIACGEDTATQSIEDTKRAVDIFAMYSESKKSKDVGELVAKMKETTDGLWEKRPGSKAFCELKKMVLVKQSADIANAVMRRF